MYAPQTAAQNEEIRANTYLHVRLSIVCNYVCLFIHPPTDSQAVNYFQFAKKKRGKRMRKPQLCTVWWELKLMSYGIPALLPSQSSSIFVSHDQHFHYPWKCWGIFSTPHMRNSCVMSMQISMQSYKAGFASFGWRSTNMNLIALWVPWACDPLVGVLIWIIWALGM